MALSDVTVTVNIVESVGVSPVWFPLFVTQGAASSGHPLAKIKSAGYTELQSLSSLIELLAPYEEGDTRTAKKEKQELVKATPIYKAVEKMYQQDDHPSKFAVIVQTTGEGEVGFDKLMEKIAAVVDRGWRQLVLVSGAGFTSTECLKYADYIEGLEARKLLFYETSSTSDATGTDGSPTYTLSDYTRTVCVYRPGSAEEHAASAVVGATAGKDPGSINYRNMVLHGVSAVAVTEEELETLHDTGLMVPVERAGDVVTSQGKSASGVRYLDTIDIEDYVVQQLIYNTQKALNVNDTVPYNNDGIAVLENVANSVMLDCCDRGMIAKTDTSTYAYTVSYPGIDLVPEDDIKSRIYKLGTVQFTVQGAIDKVEITVDMTM